MGQLDTWEQIQQLAGATAEGPPTQPFTLVIEIDAWDIRERDDWGKTKELREAGEKLDRWHWVYMATVFRLDHRGQTAGKRAVITQRGYAATRLGIEALSAQLYREALARGLGQAQLVLVIADGALWIWNLAKDRFPDARQRWISFMPRSTFGLSLTTFMARAPRKPKPGSPRCSNKSATTKPSRSLPP